MSVELFDRTGARVPFDDSIEYRWRGVSMARYERGHWRRLRSELKQPISTLEGSTGVPILRQVIKLEPTDSPVIFGLRPVLNGEASDRHFQIMINPIDGSLYREDTRSVLLDYTLESAVVDDLVQPMERYPDETTLVELRDVPDEIKPKLREIALRVVKDIPATDVKARALALERYLRDSGEFSYTLSMDVSDPNLDPVIDFLTQRKSGHCEYFASGLALLLRSVGIPSRMVNGFKGGDYNAVAGITTVRQKHAHSWCEAMVGSSGRGLLSQPQWLVLDPTPTDQRNQSVAKVGGMAANFYQFTDLIRYVWVFYIVGFNSDRQDRFLYRPIRELIEEAKRGFSIMFEAIKSLLHFPSVESFFSLRGFSVSFGGLLLLVGLIRLSRWISSRLLRKYRGTAVENPQGMIGIQFYRRLVNLLAEVGLDRPGWETPREFARRASSQLAGRNAESAAVADVPPLVVDAFYQIRFGDHTLREDDLDHVTARLDALEAMLHPAVATR